MERNPGEDVLAKGSCHGGKSMRLPSLLQLAEGHKGDLSERVGG